MSNPKYSMSVIMPAYNEEKYLREAVVQTVRVFESLNLDFEIIIVDDKSSDKTPQIAESLASHYPFVRCLHHSTNQGAGVAFRTGISCATKDYVMFVPIDSPLDTTDMEAYLPRMSICDIIVSYRVERLGYSAFARFASFMYNRILIPLLFNIGLTDVNWIQVYRRSLFSNGTISFDNSRVFFLAEILVKARRERLIIAEVPSRMKKRMYGRSTHSRISIMVQTLCDMFRFFLKMRRQPQQ